MIKVSVFSTLGQFYGMFEGKADLSIFLLVWPIPSSLVESSSVEYSECMCPYKLTLIESIFYKVLHVITWLSSGGGGTPIEKVSG